MVFRGQWVGLWGALCVWGLRSMGVPGGALGGQLGVTEGCYCGLLDVSMGGRGRTGEG